jgi:hypothetical protein
MIDQKSSAPAHPSTPKRGVCAGCGETAKALQTPRPNVGHGYTGPMYCRPCNPRFRALDFHYSSLERLAVS